MFTLSVLLWLSIRSLAVSERITSLLVLVCKRPGYGLRGDPPRAAVLPLNSLAFSFPTRDLRGPRWRLVEALRYKSEGRGFDSRWCHWNFSLT